MMRPLWVAIPDSSFSLLIALSRYFRGRGLPLAGLPGALRPLFTQFNRLPVRIRQRGYGWVGWLGAMPPEKLHRISGERFAGERGLPGNRLVGDSFFLLDPLWTKRTGSVPWWSLFNTESSARCLAEYLDGSEPYDEIWLMLLSNMMNAIGQAPPEAWERLAARARRAGGLLGVTAREFPNDMATLGRYRPALERLPDRNRVPGAVQLSRFERFVSRGDRYRVSWRESGVCR